MHTPSDPLMPMLAALATTKAGVLSRPNAYGTRAAHDFIKATAGIVKANLHQRPQPWPEHLRIALLTCGDPSLQHHAHQHAQTQGLHSLAFSAKDWSMLLRTTPVRRIITLIEQGTLSGTRGSVPTFGRLLQGDDTVEPLLDVLARHDSSIDLVRPAWFRFIRRPALRGSICRYLPVHIDTHHVRYQTFFQDCVHRKDWQPVLLGYLAKNSVAYVQSLSDTSRNHPFWNGITVSKHAQLSFASKARSLSHFLSLSDQEVETLVDSINATTTNRTR